jgi:alcohol dehydrogenase
MNVIPNFKEELQLKAAVLHQTGTPLEVQEIQSPKLYASSVRVRVLATPILSFTHVVVGGQFPFPLPTPYTPGLCAIGIVEEVADDVSGLQAGQKVFCSPLITARNNSEEPERILKGWVGMTPNCGDLLAQWKDGTFAEQTVYPLECVTPIDVLGDYDDAQLACMYYLCIAYGAFLRGEFKPGQSVLITGATGNLGTASVLVALAMGASKIYAAGRNSSVLQSLTELDPKRIVSVTLPERTEEYATALAKAAGQVDMMLDAVGLIDNSSLVEAGISLLKQSGTAVFVGGVMTHVSLSYLMTLVKELNIKGSSMYPSYAPSHIAQMIHAGLLNLEAFRPSTYPLNQINEAIAKASECRGLEYCILQPNNR